MSEVTTTTAAPTLTFDPFGEGMPEVKNEVASAAPQTKMTVEDEYEKYHMTDEEKKAYARNHRR